MKKNENFTPPIFTKLTPSLSSVLFRSTFGGGSDDEAVAASVDDVIKTTSKNGTADVINIFSLASGHLYERLMRIMMVSVVRNTNSDVKFWILKNYISPQFKVGLV